MDNQPAHPAIKRQDLQENRKDLHGRRRRLHDRLSQVCEDFVMEDLTKEHKQKALVRELRYLLDYYEDVSSWDGVQ